VRRRWVRVRALRGGRMGWERGMVRCLVGIEKMEG